MVTLAIADQPEYFPKCSHAYSGIKFAPLGAGVSRLFGFLIIAIIAITASSAAIDGYGASAMFITSRVASSETLPVMARLAPDKKEISRLHFND